MPLVCADYICVVDTSRCELLRAKFFIEVDKYHKYDKIHCISILLAVFLRVLFNEINM